MIFKTLSHIATIISIGLVTILAGLIITDTVAIVKPETEIVVPAQRYIQVSPNAFVMEDTGYITMVGVIDKSVAENFWKVFRCFEHLNVKRVVIYLNSPGGDLAAAFSIIDDSIIYLKNRGIVVETHASGEICSAAVIILVSCSYRMAGKNTVFFVHKPKAEVSSRSDAVGLMMFIEKYIGVLEKYTNLKAEEWLGKMAEEIWFDAEGALEVGLIDEILEEKDM